MTILLRHWKGLALLAVVLVLGVSWCAGSRHGKNITAAEHKRQADVWRGRAVADSLALIRLSEKADSLSREADARMVTVDTLWLPRWYVLPDTASVETVRAVGDSVVTACVSALNACAVARSADADVAFGLEVVNADLRGEVLSLREANAALKEGAKPSNIIPTIALVTIGAGVGYAVDGLPGAAKGAGLGLSVDIGWRGFRSLLESLP